MNRDEILIIKYPYKMSQQRVAAVRENILKQKESGVILLADFCSVLVKPKDIEIQVEFEEERCMSKDFIDKAKIDDLFNEIVYLSKKTICNDGKSVEIMLGNDR